ncbi:unnamed protein product [Arabidopsis lyrata]|uniref:Uncharacterized protein n=1 Tax=Arabidopsis lyrata subsp. lyrata TaxID=81972 RepID=D7L7L8_ARALL|nr:probable non-specific lipid-transfer protein 2 [Arabidopsis lyrata subsp. lyrata]EFH60266.1 hypothetical protein ARALYDRAFT_899973 [Arabidopsis lyrata subsp. lyrata]CAH8262717.1 unnamed protein product [Arabidopsis lyrata]|eukprot:XP_002884007.1 probable non-specific lipid-transfer protein 2 [Arabidopsis lyrata subsp. lyrata]
MKIISWILIAIIMILASFPAPIKVVGAKKELPFCNLELLPCVEPFLVNGRGGKLPKGCCEKMKKSTSCMCRFLTAKEHNLNAAAHRIFWFCHISVPNCPKI